MDFGLDWSQHQRLPKVSKIVEEVTTADKKLLDAFTNKVDVALENRNMFRDKAEQVDRIISDIDVTQNFSFQKKCLKATSLMEAFLQDIKYKPQSIWEFLVKILS